MDNIKRNWVAIGLAVILAVGAVWLFGIGSEGRQGPAGPQGPAGKPGDLGALSSPDIPSPYLIVGGVRHWYGRVNSMAQATTTVCSFLSPAATSSLVHLSGKFTIASSSATIVTLAKSTSNAATTTVLGNRTFLAASAQLTQIASSTTANAVAADMVFAPLTYANIGVQGMDSAGSMTAVAPVGSCSVEWIELY